MASSHLLFWPFKHSLTNNDGIEDLRTNLVICCKRVWWLLTVNFKYFIDHLQILILANLHSFILLKVITLFLNSFSDFLFWLNFFLQTADPFFPMHVLAYIKASLRVQYFVWCLKNIQPFTFSFKKSLATLNLLSNLGGYN